MAKRFITQDLVNLLINEHQVSKKKADAFVKEFFSLIEEVLEKEGYVKIKGLGTFKLISVESRESIDVNTGERIEIQGHTKVSFTPDTSLRDAINKPFSHFETVVLNENVVFDDEPPIVKSEDNVPKEEVKPTVEPPQKEKKKKKKKKFISESFLAVLFLLIAVMIGCFFSYQTEITNYFLGNENVTPLVIAEKDIIDETEAVPTDSVVLDTVAEEVPEPQKEQIESVPVQQIVAETPAPPTTVRISKAPVVPDSTNYNIVGTKQSYTLGEGETLVRVALKFYGTKDLWPYIVKHNRERIKNPNVVPYGTVLEIPELEKK